MGPRRVPFGHQVRRASRAAPMRVCRATARLIRTALTGVSVGMPWAAKPFNQQGIPMTFARVWKTSFTMTALVAGLAGCSAMQPGNMVRFSASMSGANEVPAVTTSGAGMAQATLDKDTNVLKWKISYSGLSGPATAAHFHGPAAAGSNAGVVVPFTSVASPIEGQATLTPAQVSDLMAGKWYANVHTAANKGGEIRGQMMPGM